MKPSDLAARIRRARDLYRRCTACEWRCGVDRSAGELGRCGLGTEVRLGREALSVGEEAGLSPSHLLYFAGCSFRCAFCLSGAMVERPRDVDEIGTATLVQLVGRRAQEGALNVNVLGGDPSVNVLGVLELVEQMPANVPLVWNSNFYHSPETFELLDGVVDVWLADLKFGSDDCARRLASVERYVDVVHRNLRQAARGGARLVVRHLVMPGHAQCCSDEVVRFLASELPEAEVNIAGAFVPLHRSARCSELIPPPGWDGESEAQGLRERLAPARQLQRASPPTAPSSRGYAGTLFVDAQGRITLMDPSAGVAALTARV